MWNVDLRDFLGEVGVKESLVVHVRIPDMTDEYGAQQPLDPIGVPVEGVVTEKVTTGIDTSTGSFLERVTYKIYLDKTKYGHIDFIGSEIEFRGKTLKTTSELLRRPYASHFIVSATEKKVIGNA